MDSDFAFDGPGLIRAVSLLDPAAALENPPLPLPTRLPEDGVGAIAAMDWLAPHVLSGAARLGSPTSMANMDPPTPWITWATTMWNSALNQNLLHPSTAPVARELECKVVEWLAPYFGMEGGHMLPSSTLANLTGLWAARQCSRIDSVVAADTVHMSVPKAAQILGLRLQLLPSDRSGALLPTSLPADLSRSALVLTAGSTITGSIDPLELAGQAAWTHVDAAWAGPLRFSPRHDLVLQHIERADSAAISAHKWLFQPKESALVLFRDLERAHTALTFGAGYLATPSVGLLGSHGAVATPLLATLLSWGRAGLAKRIEGCIESARFLAGFIASFGPFELLQAPVTGIVIWRPREEVLVERLHSFLPPGSTSIVRYKGEAWLRNVAANPNLDVSGLAAAISDSWDRLARVPTASD